MGFNGNSDSTSDGITHVGLGGHPTDVPWGPARYAANVSYDQKQEADRLAAASPPTYTPAPTSSRLSEQPYTSGPVANYIPHAGDSGTGGGRFLLFIVVVIGILIAEQDNTPKGGSAGTTSPLVYQADSGQTGSPANQPDADQDSISTPQSANASTGQFNNAAAQELQEELAAEVSHHSRSVAAQSPALMEQYNSDLFRLVQQTAVYPKAALANEDEGLCRVRVLFTRDGIIKDTTLVDSTNSGALDRECIQAVRRVGTLPPVPAQINPGRDEFTVSVPISFKLNDG